LIAISSSQERIELGRVRARVPPAAHADTIGQASEVLLASIERMVQHDLDPSSYALTATVDAVEAP